MKKLYEKNELSFALVWIAIYVVGTCLVEMLGETVGTYKLVSAVFHVVMALCLFLWVKRNGLAEKYGLFLPRYRLADAWFFCRWLWFAFTRWSSARSFAFPRWKAHAM